MLSHDDRDRIRPVPLVFVDVTPVSAKPRSRLRELRDLLKKRKPARRDQAADLEAEIGVLSDDAKNSRAQACQHETDSIAQLAEAQSAAAELGEGVTRSERREQALAIKRHCGAARTSGRLSARSATEAHERAERAALRSEELALLASKSSTPTAVAEAREAAAAAAGCAETATRHLDDAAELEATADAVLAEIEEEQKAEEIAALGPCDENGNRSIELVSSVSPQASSNRIQWFVDDEPFSPEIEPGTYTSVVAGDGEMHRVELKVVFPEGAEGDAVSIEFPACESVPARCEIVDADYGRCNAEGQRALRLVSQIAPDSETTEVLWFIDGVPPAPAQPPGPFVTWFNADGQEHQVTLRLTEPSGVTDAVRSIVIPRCEDDL